MEYISTKDAAARWGVSLRQVQRLLREKRIAGARKYGVSWMIPEDAVKPDDPRKKRGSADERTAANEAALRSEHCCFPLKYLSDGNIDRAYARCQSDDERELLTAQLDFFRCEAARAKERVTALFNTTGTAQIKLGSGLVLALANMSLGNLRGWRHTIALMEAVEIPGWLRMEKELLLAVANAAVHSKSGYPKWIETGAYEELPSELFPIARYVFVKILYIKWKEVDLLAVVEPLIAETHAERCDFAEVYLRLLAATAYYDHGDAEKVAAHVDAAAKLAMPLWLISPFIEHSHKMPQMANVYKDKYPEQNAVIKKSARRYFSNWTGIYNGLWEHSMAQGLTPREQEACSLAGRGMEVNEIAHRMGISKNSVKKYLSAAYGKLNIEGKNQLRRLIHT